MSFDMMFLNLRMFGLKTISFSFLFFFCLGLFYLFAIIIKITPIINAARAEPNDAPISNDISN